MRRGMTRATLSYFSKEPYARGTIVQIPIRKTDTQGVVARCEAVSATKAALRSATFSLRKLPTQTEPPTLPDAFLHTVDILSEYYAAQPGAVLFSLLPTEVRDGTIPFAPALAARTAGAEHRCEVLQAPYDARIHTYQSIIRESFAAAHSVVLVAPTIIECETLFNTLRSGIEAHTVLLHGGLGVRALRRAHAQCATHDHALLIVATPQQAVLHRADVGTVILERSRAQAYRNHTRPHLDFRHVFSVYARVQGERLVTADTLVRAEEVQFVEEDRAVPAEDLPKRLALPGTLKCIPMRDTPDGTTPFTLFSPTLLETIEKTRRARGHTFLFSARRGLAPVVACVDCGAILRCPESGSPLALHRTIRNGTEERWLISSVSGFKRRADDLCAHCGSWRLRERGIGIQQVYDELITHVPAEEVFLFDHQSAATHKKGLAIRDQFYATKRGVMLGTALALPYLTDPVELSAVVNMDALRAIPSWRQQEESLGILLALREHTLGYVLVQTRAEDDGLIAHAQKGTVGAFYAEELIARRDFKYPPFYTFVHLTWKKDASDTLGTLIAERLAPYHITCYAAPGAEEQMGYGLIRLPTQEWPDTTLVEILRALPPAVRIVINPDRIV